MEWTDESIARLRALWAEGHSTAEIGRRMGISKNAVVGKAHRLNLAPRPSPIRREAEGAPPRRPQPKRVTGPTLPPLAAAAVVTVAVAPIAVAPAVASVPPPVIAAAAVPSEPARKPAVVAAVARPVPVAEPAAAPAAKAAPAVREVPAPVRRRRAACCWPIGEPGTKSFRFCDAEATPGKPYCAEHAQLAYVKVRDRRDEAGRDEPPRVGVAGRVEAA